MVIAPHLKFLGCLRENVHREREGASFSLQRARKVFLKSCDLSCIKEVLTLEKENVRKVAQQMFEEGKTYSEISQKFNVSENTLKSWKRRDGWKRKSVIKKNATTSNNQKVSPKGLQLDKSNDGYDRIKKNLLSQLKSKGAHEDAYIDLVNDYMSMWLIKNQLIMDITTRGVQVKTFNSQGQEVYKKNDSIVELPKYNSQMLKLLNDLGLSALELDSGDDDDI